MYSGQLVFTQLAYREILRDYISTFIHISNGKMPTGYHPSQDCSQHLRCIKFYGAEQNRHLVFLTNSFDLPALTIILLYR